MDGSYFDDFSRSLAGSRRSLVSGTLAMATSWLGVSGAGAKKKHKHKKRKPKAKLNAFGCLEVGGACKNADQCCSGICDGKKGKRTCRAHGTGTCQQGIRSICDADPTIAVCNSDICACVATTAGSNYCANANYLTCADCRTDTDCEALGYPSGSACAPYDTGQCAGQCASGMTCLIPCGVELPEPAPMQRLVPADDGTAKHSRETKRQRREKGEGEKEQGT
jgi:hypothetical protein